MNLYTSLSMNNVGGPVPMQIILHSPGTIGLRSAAIPASPAGIFMARDKEARDNAINFIFCKELETNATSR